MSQYPEQDQAGNGGLPTYEDLAAQQGPNSRFGRWRGWVEKRAAERFIDLTPEERTRRRERGWGESTYQVSGDIQDIQPVRPSQPPSSSIYLHPDAASAQHTLQPQASFYSQRSSWSGVTVGAPNAPPAYAQMPVPSPTCPPLVPSGESVQPSHVKVHQFGSRFLPHTAYPLNAMLPLMGDRLLLIGHDNGLSVLNMCPGETLSTADAQVRPIWEGEGVFQLELLEFQDSGDGTPHGVVLALVGAEVDSIQNGREKRDVLRSIRMYNLSSLTSLARWAVTQKNTKPLDLRRPSSWTPQQAKKHRHNSSIQQKLKSLVLSDSNTEQHESSHISSSSSKKPEKPSLKHHESTLSTSSDDSSWDVVEELPLRWATDYIPLASPGSRLLNLSVLFFELMKKGAGSSQNTTSLAIATRQSILLYETPKGERAFRFAKEFYTPLVPRNLSFVHQVSIESTPLLRSPSVSSTRSMEKSSRRLSSIRQSLDATHDRDRTISSRLDYGPQLSLFVVFDKKAGLIRLADSAVSEVELHGDSPREVLTPISAGGGSPRRVFVRESKGAWLPPTYDELVLGTPNGVATKPIYVLTRGKITHILPAPLPAPLSCCPPLYSVTWANAPIDVSHRVCSPLDDPSFLQLIGFGEYGVEVLEIPLSVFSESGRHSPNGKGKGRQEEPVRAQVDVGGDVAFLCRGGHWDEPQNYLSRVESFRSYSSVSTARSGRTVAEAESGYYAAVRKGLEDWRVFWIGGDEKDDVDSAGN